MTTRKLFAAVTLTALAGAAITGGVFAWRTADSARGAAVVGDNIFEIVYRPVCDADAALTAADPETGESIACLTLIGWNGQTTKVGEGHGVNNGDFPLVVVDGRVAIRHIISPADADPLSADDFEALDAEEAAARPCSGDDFSGEVRIENPGEVIRPGGEGGKFSAGITVADGAPRTCQGDIVIYRVTILAENPSASDPAVDAVR
jgi:hypothetical protein